MQAPMVAAVPDRGSDRETTRIQLCGSLRVQVQGRDVTDRLPARQGRALFAYLVLNRERPVSRDELIDALWPADPPRSPAAGLSSVLARVRRAVGDDLIRGREQLAVQLDPDSEIDVETAARSADDAERALDAGDAERSLAVAAHGLEIVGRPLLPELDAPWVESRRRELADLEPRLLEARARAALGLGSRELTAAEHAARDLAAAHPYRESGYALLMQAQARRGNVAEAMQTYDRLRVLLRDELGTTPSPGVARLHERLLHHDPLEPAEAGIPLPALGSGEDRPFVGRRRELEQLRAIWERAGRAAPLLALVTGEHGVGKSRLAARFAREVHATGAAVLHGRCDEEAIVPYQPFVEAVRHCLRHAPAAAAGLDAELHALGRLVPEARDLAPGPAARAAVDPEHERYFLFEAVARLFASVTGGPLLIVLDDLHWADRPTLLLLRHLLRQRDSAGLVVVATLREDEAPRDPGLPEVLAGLRREQGLERVRLEGLGEDDAEALVAARVRAQPPAFVRALRDQTAGNPFFMEEALRSLDESGALAGDAPPERALEQMGVPEGVGEVIGRRLARVSPAAAGALTIAAAIGREFDLRVIEAVLEQPADVVLGALEEAAGTGLVVELTDRLDRFAFCHAIVRDAVYARLGTSRLVRLHAQIGAALEAQDAAPAAELAHHFFIAASLTGPDRAIRHAQRAGDDAARALAFEDAERHYRRALEAWPRRDGEHEARRCDLLLSLGRVQSRAGASEAARSTFLEAAASARRRPAPEQLARAALGLGERYWEANVVDRQYRELLAEALEALGGGDDPLRARVLARLAENLHFTSDQARGVELSAEAVAMARRLGRDDVLVTALTARHVVLLHVEHLDERLRLLDEVLALGGGRRELSAEAHQWRLFALCEQGEVGRARDEHRRLLALSGELRQPLLQHVAVGWQGVFALLSGDEEEAERLAHESFTLGRRAQAYDAYSVHAAKLFTLRRQQGRTDELLPLARQLGEGTHALAAWRAALALVQIETGDAEAGRAGYERFAATRFDAVPRDFLWLTTIALLAKACAALGDRPRAALLHEILRPYAGRMVQVSFAACWGSVERYLGILAATLGDGAAAAAHFAAALAANRAIDAPPLVAATERDRAALLG
jgi:DNA-binding SARP family transcriptional activator